MPGRNSLALLLLAGLEVSCATVQPRTDREVSPDLISSSVRIERIDKGSTIAHVEEDCEMAEVQRVLELLAAKGTRKVNLRLETGAEVEVLTQLPGGNAKWLVVAITEGGGFELFTVNAETLGLRGRPRPGSDITDVPLADGKPDWERLTAQLRSLAAKEKPSGTSVTAPRTGSAVRAIEALSRTRTALPDSPRRFLLAL
jgi:hypothetical protein